MLRVNAVPGINFGLSWLSWSLCRRLLSPLVEGDDQVSLHRFHNVLASESEMCAGRDPTSHGSFRREGLACELPK